MSNRPIVIINRFLQTNPLMIRIEKKAGHGAGKPTAKIVSCLSFVLFDCLSYVL